MSILLLIGLGACALIIIVLGLLLESSSKARAKRYADADPDNPAATLHTAPPKTTMGVRALFLLIPLGIAAVGIVVLVLGWLWRQEYQDSATWPTVAGRVTESEVDRNGGGTGIRIGDDNNDGYSVDFTYIYVVGERQYQNNDIYFSFAKVFGSHQNYDTYTEAQRSIENYPVGAQVTVRYDPDDPANSVLERRFDDGTFVIVMGGGIVGLMLGMVVLVFSLYNVLTGRRIEVD